MLTRQRKDEIVKGLTKEFKEAKSVVVTDYQGMTVAATQDLKRRLRSEKSTYKVTKKTLFTIAAKEAGVDVNFKGFQGQIGVSFSNMDEVASAKVIEKFTKENENLKILGGILESKVLSADEVKALAKLPSYEELLGQFLRVLQGPLSGFLNVLNGNTRNLVQVLKAIEEKKAA